MELRTTHFPYCLNRLQDGRYIILNRNYKPLGVQTSEWVTYETEPTVISINLTPAKAKAISWEGSENVDRVYLYNDGCIPTDGAAHMSAYLKRLGVLMNIKRKPAK